jgi:hypothetical protein
MKKKLLRSTLLLAMSMMLAFFSAALTYISPPAMQLSFPASYPFFQEPTSTPASQDTSEIGSTDGIIILGGVLVLIVIVPIFFYRKAWMYPSSTS